jgi:hypothetical protein
MKQVIQWVCVVAVAGFIGWTHAHTDEIPVVLGFILILSAILGGVFPRKPWITGIIIGVVPFIVEALHNYGWIHAPYPPSVGLPWAPLVAFLPALGGAWFGSAVRHLSRQKKHAG